MNKRKFIISLFLAALIIVAASIPVFASSYTVYGNVSQSTSQIQILINALTNDSDWAYTTQWIAFRAGEFDYYLFFGAFNDIFNESQMNYYRYYATSSGYNQTWHLEKGYEDDFEFSNPYDYTIVGNVQGSIGSSLYTDYYVEQLKLFFIILIAFALVYFIFRVKRRT